MDREQKLAMLREVRDIAASAVSLLRESKYADASLTSYDRMSTLCNALATYHMPLEQTDFVERVA